MLECGNRTCLIPFVRFKNPIYYRFIWPALLAVTITWMSGGSNPQAPFGIPHFDKIAHYFIFGLLATAVQRTRPETSTSFRQAAYAVAVTGLFGLTDEVHQYTNPERFFELADLLADTLGAITATLVYRHWTAYRKLLEYRIFQFTKNDKDIDSGKDG